MKTAEAELNHAECVERDLKEWKTIFSLSAKGYGYRINAYKGTQKLVFIPDMVDGKKVAFIYWNAFPHDCAVICNKRLFDKCESNIQLNSAEMYLRDPEAYPNDFSAAVKSFIIRNKDITLYRLIKKDDAETFQRFLQMTKTKLDTETIESYLSLDSTGVQIRAFLLSLMNTDLAKKADADSLEAALDADSFRVSDIKKFWSYKKTEDGTIVLTGYKGHERLVRVPARIGTNPVTALSDFSLSSMRPRATPEQRRAAERIAEVVVPEGICALGEKVFFGNLCLEKVYLPSTVTVIGMDTFKTYRGPSSLTVYAPSGSYAEQYAKENNIPYAAE